VCAYAYRVVSLITEDEELHVLLTLA